MAERFEEGLGGLEAGPAPTDEPASAGDASAGPAVHPTVLAMVGRFGDAVLHHEIQAGDETVVFVAPERILEILKWLRDDPDQRFNLLKDVTGVDYGGGRPLQVVYELWSMENHRQLRVKVELPLEHLQLPSAVPVWTSANWLERECYDMFGVEFTDHPDLRRILMPENYAEGHPLRKDFPLRGRFTRAEQTRRALSLGVDDFYIPDELGVREPHGQAAPRAAPSDPRGAAPATSAPDEGPRPEGEQSRPEEGTHA